MGADSGVDSVQKLREVEFVIAGDSHIYSMGASQAYTGPIALVPISKAAHGYWLMGPWRGRSWSHYWDGLATNINARVAVLAVMGNQHFGTFLLTHLPLFDFVDPRDPEPCYPGAVIVPRRMVKALPAFETDWLKQLIDRLWASGCRDVFVAGTPPVREDYGDNINGIRTSGYFYENAAKMGFDISICPFTPAPVMKRLWGVLQESLADAASAAGARFIPVAEAALTPNGYLSEPYRGPLWNFTHANDAYGQMMLDQIVRTVGECAA